MDELLRKRQELLLAKDRIKARLERLSAKRAPSSPLPAISPIAEDEERLLDVWLAQAALLVIATSSRIIAYALDGSIQRLMDGSFKRHGTCIVNAEGLVLLPRDDRVLFQRVPAGFIGTFHQRQFYLIARDASTFRIKSVECPAEQYHVDGCACICSDRLIVASNNGSCQMWDAKDPIAFAYHGNISDILLVRLVQQRLFLIYQRENAIVLGTSNSEGLVELNSIAISDPVGCGILDDFIWLQSCVSLYIYQLSSFALQAKLDLPAGLTIVNAVQLSRKVLVMVGDGPVVWIELIG